MRIPKLIAALLSLAVVSGAVAAAEAPAPTPVPSPEIEKWVEKARALGLANDVQWLNLGHYRPSLWGGVKSQAAGSNFFNAGKSGTTHPDLELEATIRALFRSGPLDDTHPQCTFPGRTRWLAKKLGWTPGTLPRARCTKFLEFFNRLQGKSATLVFSSYYLNSPSSTFGHTLIRVNKTEHSVSGRRYELLDNGLNFAALMLSNNPVIYAVSAIAGLFPGSFTSTPYFYKVREYNDFEARDLWEYDLNLTQEEVDLLVAHFWELGSTRFDYFYLTQNCSYHMLSAIDAAAPQYHLQDKLPYWVIPSDTIKIVYETPGLVRQIHYRAAVRTQFRTRAAGLSRGEKDELLEVVNGQSIPDSLKRFEPHRQAAILDAAMDYVDWHYAKLIVAERGGPVEFKQKLLVARASLGIQSEELKVPFPEREQPHTQHSSARAWASAGYSDQTGSFYRLAHRFALHDLLDPLRGFPEYGQIEFLNFVVRHNPREKSWWLEDSALFSIVSLAEQEEFNHAPSWKFKLGGRTVRDRVCENCYAFAEDAGGGVTFRLLNAPKTSLVLTADEEFMSSPRFRGTHFRLRLGPTAMIRSTITPNLQVMLSAGKKWPVLSELSDSFEASADVRWAFTKAFAFDAKSSYFTSPRFWEHYAGLMFYY